MIIWCGDRIGSRRARETLCNGPSESLTSLGRLFLWLQLSHLVKDSYDALVHRPESWPALNLRLKEKGAKDVLFGVEDVIKARGPGAVRALLTGAGPPAVDADTVWSLHQPLLSLLLFILSGTNDIHKKLIKVPDLKADICKALSLGAPTKVKTLGPKPEAVHAVKKLKRLTRVPPGKRAREYLGRVQTRLTARSHVSIFLSSRVESASLLTH